MKNLFSKINRNDLLLVINYLAMIAAYIVFSISMFNNWQASLYISGVIILITLVVSFLFPLFKKDKINIFEWVEMGTGFVVFIVLFSIYVAAIQIDSLRIVVTAISSACIGGLLTLTGVGLSIKYTRIYREEEKLEQLKPHIYIVGDIRWNSLPKEKRIETVVPISEDSFSGEQSTNYEFEYNLSAIRLANSDLSISIVRGLFFNDKFVRFEYEIPLLRDSYTALHFDSFLVGLQTELKKIYLLCEDILQHSYIVELRFAIENHSGSNWLIINSAFNPEPFKE